MTQLQMRKDISWSAKTDVKAYVKNTFSKRTAISSEEIRKNHKDEMLSSGEKLLSRT